MYKTDRDKLDALLSDFRAIADAEMADVVMSPNTKEKIIEACTAKASEDAKGSSGVVRKFTPKMSWGTGIAAAALLIVALIGGAKLIMTPTPAPRSFESAPDSTEEEISPAEEPMLVMGVTDGDEEDDDTAEMYLEPAEEPAAEPSAVPESDIIAVDMTDADESEAVAEPAERAPTPEPDNKNEPTAAASGSTQEPEEELPEDEPATGADGEIIEFEDVEYDDDVAQDDADADSGESSGAAEGGANTVVTEWTDEDTQDEQTAEANDADISEESFDEAVVEAPELTTYDVEGAVLFVTGRAVETSEIAISLIDGTVTTWGDAQARTAQTAPKPTGDSVDEDVSDDVEMQAASDNGWIVDDWYYTRVLTLEVDVKHWGDAVSTGTRITTSVSGVYALDSTYTLLLRLASPDSAAVGLYSYSMMYDATGDVQAKEGIAKLLQ